MKSKRERVLERALHLAIFDYMVNGTPKCVEVCGEEHSLFRPCLKREVQCTEQLAKYYERKAKAEGRTK